MRSDATSAGMPPRHSRAAGLERLRYLKDDAVPLSRVARYGTVGDGPGEAFPQAVQFAVAVVTMRYIICT